MVGVALLVGCVPLALFISWLATTLWPFLRGRIGPLEWYAPVRLPVRGPRPELRRRPSPR